MIINRVVLQDFGAFRGRNEIELRPRDRSYRPIIIFGGRNGAGKTTIFEAIRVCLYGLNALPGRQRRADYEQFLVDRIHRHKSLPVQPQEASVEVEFEYAHLGKLSTYSVRRTWVRRSNGAQETLTILRDGKPLDDIEQDHWQDFIKDLIPPGLSQLFFFDGEKIEELAAHGTEVEQFRDSFRSLLGLDLVERLQDDLSIHISRQERAANTDAVERKLEAARADIVELERTQFDVARKQSQAQNRVHVLRAEIHKQENKLTAEGGGFAARRSEMKSKAERIDLQINELNAEIRELATGLLPIAFSPEYLHRLEDRLLEEAEISRVESARELVKEHQERAKRRVREADFWKGLLRDEAARKEATKRVATLLNDLTPPRIQQGTVVHAVSETERARLLTWIREARTSIPKELGSISKKLEKLHKERQSIQNALRRAPQEDVLAPILAKLKELNKELGVAESELKQLAAEADVLRFKLTGARRLEAQVLEELGASKGVSKRIEAAIKARGVLEKYLARITDVKLGELSAALADSFSKLSNKPAYYARVHIDPSTFETTIYTQHGDKVTRDQLSAGERQIFATSLLWALAKTSGRPLPFIIDTPLGRLDHAHRRNLVEHFFPYASHQVIILSTDAEIEGKYHDLLEPFISHGFTLRYDPKDGVTSVHGGYAFGRRRVEVKH